MWKKWLQAKCLEICLDSKHLFYSVLYRLNCKQGVAAKQIRFQVWPR